MQQQTEGDGFILVFFFSLSKKKKTKPSHTFFPFYIICMPFFRAFVKARGGQLVVLKDLVQKHKGESDGAFFFCFFFFPFCGIWWPVIVLSTQNRKYIIHHVCNMYLSVFFFLVVAIISDGSNPVLKIYPSKGLLSTKKKYKVKKNVQYRDAVLFFPK